MTTKSVPRGPTINEPRIGSPERREWQDAKNREASAVAQRILTGRAAFGDDAAPTINEGGQDAAGAASVCSDASAALTPVPPSPDDDLVTLLRDTATDVLDPGYPYCGVPELVRDAADAIERLTADLRAEERGQDNLRRVIANLTAENDALLDEVGYLRQRAELAESWVKE